MNTQDFINQVLQTIGALGGLTGAAKVAGVIMLVVASMKVSVLDDLLWNKLGRFQVWVAPIFGAIAGILTLKPFTLAGLFVYVSAGAGAVFLHEILDLIKVIPGIGPLYVTLINVVEGALGGNSKPTLS